MDPVPDRAQPVRGVNVSVAGSSVALNAGTALPILVNAPATYTAGPA